MRLFARNVSIERSGRLVLADLSFGVDAGEAVVVTGPNGSGKSTLLAAIAGLLPLSSGTIDIDDLPQDDERNAAECAHYVGHRDALKPALTLRETLAFWGALLGGDEAGASPEEALERVRLIHAIDFPAGFLSAGQRRRLSLARLLVAPRPVWLLDEPINALDARSQQELTALMEAHLAGGGMIVAATHAPLGLARARALDLGAAA